MLIPEEEIKRRVPRRSLALFHDPDNDTMVTCLDGSNQYPPIKAKDWVDGKRYSAYKWVMTRSSSPTYNGVKMIARITYNAADVIINIVHLPGGGGSVYSKFQVTGMIRCDNQNPKNFLAPNLTPEKSHADFPSLENFPKALNDVTRKIKLQKRVCLYFIRRTTRPGCACTTANTAPPPKILESKISNP